MTTTIPTELVSEISKPTAPVRFNFDGRQSGYQWESKCPKDELPDASTPVLKCAVEVSSGVFLYGAACGQHLFLDIENNIYIWSKTPRTIEEVDPFFQVEVLGEAYHKMIEVQERVPYGYYSSQTKTVSKVDSYGDTYDYNTRQQRPGQPYNYLKVRITFMGESIETVVKFHQPDSGEIDLDAYPATPSMVKISSNFFGKIGSFDFSLTSGNRYSDPWDELWRKEKTCTVKQGKDALFMRFFELNATNDKRGIHGVEKGKDAKKILYRLQQEKPLLFAFYQYLKHGKTTKGISNNRLLTAVLKDCGKNYKKLEKQMNQVLETTLSTSPVSSYSVPATRDMCLRFPSAIKVAAAQRAKTEWNFRIGLKAQAEGLGVDPRRHARLFRAICQSKISINLFHTTGNPLDLINVEFDVWERALRRKDWPEVIFAICSSITNKNRFEKHITPYLSFLFRIEKYLKRHTGRTWTAFPKLVNSEAQLEMAERDENGTVKTRSALTPIPDNEKNTITVPYAGIRMHGAQTTYCYSKLYQVFEADTIDLVTESVIPADLEKKLNGRDDYGLMYYTLDGSLEAQGYPTFLVIFERRNNGEYTFVHFHRVHPCRKKNGLDTPACRLIEECYRYMAGNVRAEEITAQQGDLIFIKAEQPANLNLEEGKAVEEFESHRFARQPLCESIKLWPNENKSIKNRLGFIYSEADFVLEHPEHEYVKFTAGYYEIRRCRSWEANPSAVWSYTFD